MADVEPLALSGGAWYRVCLNTIVRKDHRLDSERLRILPMGSRVYVVEQRDRRVRISYCANQRIDGWCSMTSSNGDTILCKVNEADVNLSNVEVEKAKMQEQQNAQQEVAHKVDELTAALSVDEQQQMHHMIKTLHDLRGQVDEAATKKRQLEQIKKENALNNQEIVQQEKEIQKLKVEYERMQSQFENKINTYATSGNEELNRLAVSVQEAEFNHKKMQEDLNLVQKQIDWQRKQNQKRKEELQNLLLQDSDVKNDLYFRPEDVLFTQLNAPCGQELVIIKYYGPKPDGVELVGKAIENCDHIVGVERQFPAQGITHQGQGIFEVSENRYGMWLNPSIHVAKIIQPIELLQRLQAQLQLLVKANNSKE